MENEILFCDLSLIVFKITFELLEIIFFLTIVTKTTEIVT